MSRFKILWLLAIMLTLTLIDYYFGRDFAKGFCFGALAACLLAFWEEGRRK